MFKFLSKSKKEISKVEPKAESEGRKPIKAIVNGKLYDTSKATEICVFETGFCAFAILFRTEKGNFFAQQYGKLYEVTEEAAKSILAEYPEKYIEIFREVEEA